MAEYRLHFLSTDPNEAGDGFMMVSTEGEFNYDDDAAVVQMANGIVANSTELTSVTVSRIDTVNVPLTL